MADVNVGEQTDLQAHEAERYDVPPADGERPRTRATGAFTPYSVGDPGRAAGHVVPYPDRENWHRRDSVFDGVTLGVTRSGRRLVLRAASVRGLSHRAYGKPRQDEYGYRITPDGRYLVLCVADGLSSGPRSHLAAEVAVRTGTALLVTALAGTTPAELDWEQIVGEVAGHIVVYARKRLPDGAEMTVDDIVGWMGTTATYAVVDLADEVLDVHAVMVGDSSVWVLRADGWQPLSEVKNAGADVATSAVEALPQVGQRDRVRLHTKVGAGEALVLMTDGVGDPLGDGDGEVGAFLGAAWRTPPHEVEFVGQVGFSRRTFDDDRTVIAVWPAVPS
jgi:serine/threonine protein phosphatase PrpC